MRRDELELVEIPATDTAVLEKIGPDASDSIPILTTLSKEGQFAGTRKAATNALEKIQDKK